MIAPSRVMLTCAILLRLCGWALVIAQSKAPSSPYDLVEVAIQNELNSADVIDVRWRYLLDKEVDGKLETKEVIETKFGSVDRLIAVAGKPLTETQQRD